MTKILTRRDVRDVLAGLRAAIELDQRRVDAIPAERFHPAYDDDMWREWRTAHTDYIAVLISTMDAIPPNMLRELTEMARRYRPDVVGRVARELFAEFLCAIVRDPEIDSAAVFFGLLIEQVGGKHAVYRSRRDARTSAFRWFAVDDPLGIERDPECGYGMPPGGVVQAGEV
jgi:hypothetical protein